MWMHHKRNFIYCRNDNKNLRTLKPSFYLFNHNSILPRPFSIGWMHFGHASLTKYNRFIFQMIFHIILMIEREKNPKERIDVNESTESLSRFMRVCVCAMDRRKIQIKCGIAKWKWIQWIIEKCKLCDSFHKIFAPFRLSSTHINWLHWIARIHIRFTIFSKKLSRNSRWMEKAKFPECRQRKW